MTALSTHDTKRSEDVRARLLAVAGDGESWQPARSAFAEAAAERGVDLPTAHLVWQTLVGAGRSPTSGSTGYLIKAMREAKQRTSWLDADPDYEARVVALARAATPAGPLHGAGRHARSTHNARGGPRDGARPEAAAADAARRARTSTRAARSSTCRWSTPTTGARSTTTAAATRLDAAARPARRATSTTRSCWSRTRALRLRRELPDCFGDAGDYQPLAGTLAAPGRLRPRRRGRDARHPRPPSGSTRRRLGRRDRGAARGPVARRADRRACTSGAENRCADVSPTCPVALLRRVHRLSDADALGAAPAAVDLVTDAGRTADDAAPTAAGGRRRRRWPTATATASPRRRRAAARPARRSRCPTGRTARRRVFDPARFAWTDDGVARRRRSQGAVIYETARRHVHPRGHARRGDRAAAPTSSTSASTSSS